MLCFSLINDKHVDVAVKALGILRNLLTDKEVIVILNLMPFNVFLLSFLSEANTQAFGQTGH